MTWHQWLIFALALAALGPPLHGRVLIGVLRSRLIHANAVATGILPQRNTETGERTVAAVVNPARIGSMRDLKTVVEQAAADVRYPVTRQYGTTPGNPGAGQARAALAEGPAVVVTAGGDGTVRTVAGQLAGIDVPLGILLLGTGNLLVHNLNPLLGSSLGDLVMVALTGRSQRIDVGRTGAPEPMEGELVQIAGMGPNARPITGCEPSLVVAGMDFGADIINDADHRFKHATDWGAYLVLGFKFMRRLRVNATAVAGDGSNGFRVEARSILFANYARFPAGFALTPDARIGNDWLNLVLVDTKDWIFGWSDAM